MFVDSFQSYSHVAQKFKTYSISADEKKYY